jgi:hypothetical protein
MEAEVGLIETIIGRVVELPPPQPQHGRTNEPATTSIPQRDNCRVGRMANLPKRLEPEPRELKRTTAGVRRTYKRTAGKSSKMRTGLVRILSASCSLEPQLRGQDRVEHAAHKSLRACERYPTSVISLVKYDGSSGHVWWSLPDGFGIAINDQAGSRRSANRKSARKSPCRATNNVASAVQFTRLASPSPSV